MQSSISRDRKGTGRWVLKIRSMILFPADLDINKMVKLLLKCFLQILKGLKAGRIAGVSPDLLTG